MRRRTRIVGIVVVVMLLIAASPVLASGQPEDPADSSGTPGATVSENRKIGQIEEPGIVVETKDDDVRVRFFEPVRDVPFGKPIGANEFVFISSQRDLERPVQAEGLRGLANIDLFLVVDESPDDGRPVRVERSIQSIDPERAKVTIRFTQDFLAERAGVKPRDFQEGSTLRLYFEMVAGALVPHPTAVELGYISPLRFAPDYTWVEFDVYIWRTDDLMVYIG